MLATKEKFVNFELQMFVRHQKHHNSGIVFRNQGKGTSGEHYEIQLHDVEGAHYPTGSLYHIKRSIYPKIEPEVWFPVQLDAEQLKARVAVSKDVSSRGCLLSTASTISPGSKVAVTFHVPGEASARRIEGHVVRVEKNDEDPGGMWPNRVAIAFDEPVPELEQQLIAADTMRRIQLGRGGS